MVVIHHGDFFINKVKCKNNFKNNHVNIFEIIQLYLSHIYVILFAQLIHVLL